MESVKINVFNIVGNGNCTLPEDGEKVFEAIKKALESNKKAMISFKNVTTITSAFLNSAIGKLYGSFEDAKLKESLQVEDMAVEDQIILKRVVIGAKLYFKDSQRMVESIKEILGEDDE
ncbi:STAS-like domain-containing protein [Sulfuricurvum sp.]|uniref:STAS-like domain-containing protein n=1 Tax=Sulfuricurvum sp. TaxID=2025608 RepID=UPI00261A15FE|nr:STAS-like domain-containing protein [Sulfuricurvum sp.]MDD2267676.1 STAS-like domain-containing protein [Sulfuricurvum sp.]MDD2784113.1 STAS-like domain-containing protein [Sulfuricurvum sp.]